MTDLRLTSFKAYLAGAREHGDIDAYSEVIDSLLAARPSMPDRMDPGELTLLCERIGMGGKRRAIARELFAEYRQSRKANGW